MNRFCNILAALLVSSALLTGCNNQDPGKGNEPGQQEEQPKQGVTKVIIEGAPESLELFSSVNLTAKQEAVGAVESNFVWSTETPDLISLSSTSGSTITVNALAAGEAKVKVTSGHDSTKSDEITILIVDNRNWSDTDLQKMRQTLGVEVPYISGFDSWEFGDFEDYGWIFATSTEVSNFQNTLAEVEKLSIESGVIEEGKDYKYIIAIPGDDYSYIGLEVMLAGSGKNYSIVATREGYSFESEEWNAEYVASVFEGYVTGTPEVFVPVKGTHFEYTDMKYFPNFQEYILKVSIKGSKEQYFSDLHDAGWFSYLNDKNSGVNSFISPKLSIMVDLYSGQTEGEFLAYFHKFGDLFEAYNEWPSELVDLRFKNVRNKTYIAPLLGDKFYEIYIRTDAYYFLVVGNARDAMNDLINNHGYEVLMNSASSDPDDSNKDGRYAFTLISPYHDYAAKFQFGSDESYEIYFFLTDQLGGPVKPRTVFPSEDLAALFGPEVLGEVTVDEIPAAPGKTFVLVPSLNYQADVYLYVAGSQVDYKNVLLEADWTIGETKESSFTMISPNSTLIAKFGVSDIGDGRYVVEIVYNGEIDD